LSVHGKLVKLEQRSIKTEEKTQRRKINKNVRSQSFGKRNCSNNCKEEITRHLFEKRERKVCDSCTQVQSSQPLSLSVIEKTKSSFFMAQKH